MRIEQRNGKPCVIIEQADATIGFSIHFFQKDEARMKLLDFAYEHGATSSSTRSPTTRIYFEDRGGKYYDETQEDLRRRAIQEVRFSMREGMRT